MTPLFLNTFNPIEITILLLNIVIVGLMIAVSRQLRVRNKRIDRMIVDMYERNLKTQLDSLSEDIDKEK
jgi:hypothetical protein